MIFRIVALSVISALLCSFASPANASFVVEKKSTQKKAVPARHVQQIKKLPAVVIKKKPLAKKAPAKKRAVPRPTAAGGKTRSSLSAEIVAIKTIPIQAEAPKPQVQVIEKPKADQKSQTNESLISLTQQRADLAKHSADGLLAQMKTNPYTPEFRDQLRRDNKIPDLQAQFNKLQSQVDTLEQEIRSLQSEAKTSDIDSRTLALQKTKFLLLQQQQDVLQQIELKENYVGQLVDLSRRDYDFVKRQYDELMQKYEQDTSFIKQLKQ